MAPAGPQYEQETGIAQPPVRPAPFRLPRTVRAFVFQIATIIAGILIALWVNNLVEGRREEALVRDAHAAISREIADNLHALRGSLPSLDEHERHLANGLRFSEDLLKRGKTDIHELQFSLQMPSLNRASWQTAERTGRFATWRSRMSGATPTSTISRISSSSANGSRSPVSLT